MNNYGFAFFIFCLAALGAIPIVIRLSELGNSIMACLLILLGVPLLAAGFTLIVTGRT